MRALPDAPTVMLGARVRVPLDDLLNDLVHEARHHQVRTSKVELVELALLSLAGVDPCRGRRAGPGVPEPDRALFGPPVTALS